MEATGLLLSECFPSSLLACRPILGQRCRFIDEHRRCSRQDKKPKSVTSLWQSSTAFKTLQGFLVHREGQRTEAGRLP